MTRRQTSRAGISRRSTAIDKVVISDGLTPEQTAPWHNTRIVERADAHEQLADRKRQQGKDILASAVTCCGTTCCCGAWSTTCT